MSNQTRQQLHNKNSIELKWYIEQIGIWAIKSFNNEISENDFSFKIKELEQQCEEMIIKGKESCYVDGFSRGYNKALELIENQIKNELKIYKK